MILEILGNRNFCRPSKWRLRKRVKKLKNTKKSLKNKFCQKKKLKYKNNKSLLSKNPSRYVFYNFDTIKKKCFFILGKKWHLWGYFTETREKRGKKSLKNKISPQKSCNIKTTKPFFKFHMGIKMCRNFWTEKTFFPKSVNVHIFELLKHWGPMANLKEKFENSLGGEAPIFISPIILTNF